jgi:hypothetical protein
MLRDDLTLVTGATTNVVVLRTGRLGRRRR